MCEEGSESTFGSEEGLNVFRTLEKPDVNPDSMEAESTGKPDQLVVKQVEPELKDHESDTDLGVRLMKELADQKDELEKK